MSHSKLSSLCDGLIEAGWLAVLVITPLFFNLDSRRVFEADKLLWLRAITTGMASVWLLKWIEQRRAPRLAVPSAKQNVLRWAIVIFAAAQLLTTLTSIAPRISFFGSYTRLQGLYTTLSYLVIFGLIVDGLRTRRQLDRLILTVILTSLPVALYAILQNYGLDPLAGTAGSSDRISATLGDPSYLAAYLIMAFWFTFSRISASWGAIRRRDKHLAIGLAQLGSYCGIALTQLIVIWLAASWAPFLGMLAGTGLCVLLIALLRHKRVIAIGLVGLAVIVLAVLLIINLPNSSLATLRDVPRLGRLINFVDNSRDNAQVDALIWQGNVDLMRPHDPLRLSDNTTDPLNTIRSLIGYGPETMYLTFGPYFPPALVSQTGYAGDTLVGRSHNETWDSIVNGGMIGLLAYQLLMAGFFVYGLQTIGLIADPRQRNSFIAGWLGFGLAGGLFAIVLGQPKYLGLAIALGTLFALGLYLLIVAIRSGNHSRDHTDQILPVTLMATTLAYYVETQFGFGISATNLLFWICAAILILIGSKHIATQDIQPESNIQRSNWISQAASTGLIISLVLVTWLYEFVTNGQQLTSAANILWQSFTFNSQQNETSYAVLIVIGLVWALAALTILSGLTRFTSFRQRVTGMGLFTSLSVGLAIVFGLGRAYQLTTLPPLALGQVNAAVAYADQRTGLFDTYTFSAFLLIGLLAVALVAEIGQMPKVRIASRWSIVALLPLAAAAYLWVNTTNFNLVRADIVYNLGQQYDLYSTVSLYQHAIELAPNEDVYYRGLGQTYLRISELIDAQPASQLTEPTPFETIAHLSPPQTAELSPADLLIAAQAVFSRGRELNPLNVDQTIGLARIVAHQIDLTTDPIKQASLVGQANRYYALAVTLRPRDSNLSDEWAALKARLGQLPTSP